MLNKIKEWFSFSNKELDFKLLELDYFLVKNQIILCYDLFGSRDYAIIKIYFHEFYLEINSVIIKNWRSNSYSWVYSSEDGFDEISCLKQSQIDLIVWIVAFLNENPDILNKYKEYKNNESKQYHDCFECKVHPGIKNFYFKDKILFENIDKSIESYLKENKNEILDFLFNNKIKEDEFKVAMFRYMEKLKY